MSELLTTLLCAIICILSHKWSYQKGYAAGWVDQFFATIKKDRDRRDHKGRFKAKQEELFD